MSHSFKSGDHEGCWATQAQPTRREIVETSVSWAESDTGRLFAAISEEGESVSLVSALVSQLVLVYMSVSVSAVRECSPWWNVSVYL